jgi:hypothetical protein
MYSNLVERHPYPRSHSTAPLTIRNPFSKESHPQFGNPVGDLGGTEAVPQPDFAALEGENRVMALGG